MSFTIESLLGIKDAIKKDKTNLIKSQKSVQQRKNVDDNDDVFGKRFIPAKCFSWKHFEDFVVSTANAHNQGRGNTTPDGKWDASHHPTPRHLIKRRHTADEIDVDDSYKGKKGKQHSFFIAKHEAS